MTTTMAASTIAVCEKAKKTELSNTAISSEATTAIGRFSIPPSTAAVSARSSSPEPSPPAAPDAPAVIPVIGTWST